MGVTVAASDGFVFLELAIERRLADAKQSRGNVDVGVRVIHRLQDMAALQFVERQEPLPFNESFGCR